MAFIRRVRRASGATAVQIAEYVRGRGRQRIVKHIGSAHTEAEFPSQQQAILDVLHGPKLTH